MRAARSTSRSSNRRSAIFHYETACIRGDRLPLGWDGAAPGGRHRAGVLRFGAILPRPQWIELRISRPGEPQARSFRWKLE